MHPSTLQIGTTTIPVAHTTSGRRRRSISLRIAPTGLHITTPVRYDKQLVERFISSRHQRILKHRNQLQTIHQPKLYVPGDPITYLGETYHLILTETNEKTASISLEDETITCALPSSTPEKERKTLIEQTLDDRYRLQATEIITNETRAISSQHGFSDDLPITIKAYKSVYGKCKSAKELFFNYRLIKFPLPIIKHVIIHELAHTKYMGHHSRFRNLVAKLDPDTPEHKKRLRQHGTAYLWK